MHLVDLTMFYPSVTGGVGTYLSAKSRWLRSHTGIRHTIVAPVSRRSEIEKHVVSIPGMTIPGSHGYRIPLPLPMPVALARRAVERLEPDLVEVGDPYQCAWSGLQASRRLGVPAVAFYHSDLPVLVGQRFGRIAKRAATRYVASLYPHFDLVLTPSACMVAKLRKLGITRVERQPLGVDTKVFAPEHAHADLRAKLGLGADTRLLVYAGRFSREKRLPLLMQAVRRLGKPYHLLVIGSGPELTSFPQLTRLPFQREPARLAALIGGCDLFVHPGDKETFGMVALEAMACGVPVLGVNAGGVAELVDGQSGMLVEPGSVDALAQGIEDIYRRDMRSLGAMARERMLCHYDWSRVMPQLIHHYSSLVGANQHAALEVRPRYAID
ncbi:glycosyltransferase family 4 protein [Noviherbaspirillum pedocola]|uniref:Glycosyltransferase family 1 protein n=1 Tax=Noviherbaspirillum pedocola TaxID=2801341 RepID=A0A934SXP0_9BURK|nr:glycosyltransferase family 1 protein [Noviherbaspirillum pedocola]MBK4737433.1 glycosyltransferase family 1 protein [Noviherbaspirillum pedocola]